MQHRRSPRLAAYDYSSPGAYFVTTCTLGRACLFGRVVEGDMLIDPAGQVVEDTWESLRLHFPWVELDAFVVMPNHVHGIVVLTDAASGLRAPSGGAASSAPTAGDAVGAASRAPTLGEVVRVFKSTSAIGVNRLLSRVGQPLWQRNYYEHIIRDERSLVRIREYIETNPPRWQSDRENVERTSEDTFDTWLNTFNKPKL